MNKHCALRALSLSLRLRLDWIAREHDAPRHAEMADVWLLAMEHFERRLVIERSQHGSILRVCHMQQRFAPKTVRHLRGRQQRALLAQQRSIGTLDDGILVGRVWVRELHLHAAALTKRPQLSAHERASLVRVQRRHGTRSRQELDVELLDQVLDCSPASLFLWSKNTHLNRLASSTANRNMLLPQIVFTPTLQMSTAAS